MFHEASKFVLTELQKEHQLAIKASAEAAARDVEGQQDDGPKTPVNYNGFTLHMSKWPEGYLVSNARSSAW